MKTGFVISGLILLIVTSCTKPLDLFPKSSIRISVTGISEQNVTLSWDIHGRTGSQTMTLNSGSSNPWTVAFGDIDPNSYSNVYLTVQNSMGNQVVSSGDSAVIAPGGWIGSEKTLDLTDLGVPLDLSSVSIGDVLEFSHPGDAGPPVIPPGPANLFIIDVQNTIPPHQLTVKDSDNQFSAGAFQILSSNSAYFTTWIERDGVVIGPPKTYGTLTGDVDFSYGSNTW